jgi:hypothetical protein
MEKSFLHVNEISSTFFYYMQIFILFISIKPNLRERWAMEDDSTSNEDKDFGSFLRDS